MSDATYEVRMLDGSKYRIATFKKVDSVEVAPSLITFKDEDCKVVGIVFPKQGDIVERKP